MSYDSPFVPYETPAGTYADLAGVSGVSPPFVDDVPPTLSYQPEIDRNPLGYALMRHFRRRTRGVNVYQWEDGTFHQSQIWEGSVLTNLPNAVITETPPAHRVVRTLWGGHVEPLDPATTAALIAANYGYGQ